MSQEKSRCLIHTGHQEIKAEIVFFGRPYYKPDLLMILRKNRIQNNRCIVIRYVNCITIISYHIGSHSRRREIISNDINNN